MVRPGGMGGRYGRAVWAGAHGDKYLAPGHDPDIAIVQGNFDFMRTGEPAHTEHGLHADAGKPMLQHVHFMIQRHVQARHQVLGLDVVFDPIGRTIKPTLPPAGQVEHGFAEGLGWDGACMHRNAPDPAALFHHEYRHPALSGLNGGSAAGGTAADDNGVVLGHGAMLRCAECGRKRARRVSGGQTATFPLLCPTG